MKKITELVTKTEKPEHKAKRKAITFGSFKRAEDRQVAERKQKEHEAELAGIAENARIQRAVEDEHQRVIKEQNSEKRNKFVTESLTNAFKPKIKDMNTVREQAINTYLPREFIPVAKDYPEPFKDEPALNKELADFKVKINEHLQKVGFASSGGGGIGSIADANDVEDLSDGEFLQFRASDGKFIGGEAGSVTTLALSKLDIDGGTDIGAAIVDADLLVIDDGAGGTNRKTAASRIKTYVADVTLTTAAQTNITSVGTLTALQVDNLNINGNTLSSTAGTDLLITPLSGQQIVLDGTIIIDAGVVTGATSITSTAFVGDITGDVTGNADTATLATTVVITDNESTNENNAIIFTAGGDLDGGNLGLESDGDLKYNPSTGTLSATNISVSGTFSTVNSVTMDANNAVIFEGSTADAHETTLTSIDATGDRTISLPNVSGTLPVLAAASATAITSTPEELNKLDGATVVVGEINALDLGSTAVGTAIASKAVILDSNLDYTGIRNLTITGEIDAATGDYSGAVDVAGALTTVAITTTGVVDITDATDSSNDTGDTGALRTEGGASIAKKLFVGSAVDFSTTLQVDGVATFTGRDIHSGGITVANAGQIGSVGDADAIAIASNGVVTFSQIPVMPANSIDSDEYIDGSIDAEHFSLAGLQAPHQLDGTPPSDHTATGPQTSTFNAGYAVAAFDLVFLGSSSTWLEADADATGTSINMLGIALAAADSGSSVNVALPGSFVRDDTFNFTPGAALYVSGTLGAMTHTKPTGSGDIVRAVGYAATADVVFFQPSSDFLVLA